MASQRVTQVLQDELDIGTQLTNLEERAVKLETDFTAMFLATKELKYAAKRYIMRVETERKSWDLMETICGAQDASSREILDHVKVFFNFLLEKMKSRGADVTDIKMLWHLADTEGVRQALLESIKSFGFKETDFEDIKILLAVTYKLQLDIERVVGVEMNEESEESKCMVTESKVKTTLTFKEIHAEEATKLEKISSQYYESLLEGDANTQSTDNSTTQKFEEANVNGDIEKDNKAKTEADERKADGTDYPDFSRMQAIKGFNYWGEDDGMRRVINLIVYIVLYSLNAGRQGEPIRLVERKQENGEEVIAEEVITDADNL